jgi:hypothetical protein
MPTANHDASYLTRVKQNNTLRAFYTNLKAAQNAGTTVRVEQPSLQTEQVITSRRETPCGTCTDNIYKFNPNTTAGNVSG